MNEKMTYIFYIKKKQTNILNFISLVSIEFYCFFNLEDFCRNDKCSKSWGCMIVKIQFLINIKTTKEM